MSTDEWTTDELRILHGKQMDSQARMQNAHRSLENALREFARAKEQHAAYLAAIGGHAITRANVLGMTQPDSLAPFVTEREAIVALVTRAQNVMVTDWLTVTAVVDTSTALTTGEDWTQYHSLRAPTSTDHGTLGLIRMAEQQVSQRVLMEGP